MKLGMDKTLQFWVDVAAEQQILREYERRGEALRCLNRHGRIVWKASPRFLSMLADAERDADDDLAEWP
jgi:hypothetical protein